jgi:hypothetical protein
MQLSPRLWLKLAGIGAINMAIPFALFAGGASRAAARSQCQSAGILL